MPGPKPPQPEHRPPVGSIEVRVRYAETDRGGVVYHANYLNYFEWGRTEFLRERGTTYREMEDQGHLLVVVSAELKFIRSAGYDDLLTIRTQLDTVSPVRLAFSYRIERGGELICTGSTHLGGLSAATRRPTRFPDAIYRRLTGE